MARDYKNAQPAKRKTTRKKTTRRTTTKKTRSKQTQATGIPRWVVFLGGIVATLAILWAKDSLLDFDTPDEPRDLTPYSQRVENAESDVENLREEIPATQAVKKDPKEFEPKKDPRFTFYERLPKDEIIIPQEALEVEVDENKLTNNEPLEDIVKQGSYVLQAGSFQVFSDADRRKAELALLGLESAIQKVSIDKRNWFRVRIGPFTNLDELNSTRLILRDGSIDALVIRTQ